MADLSDPYQLVGRQIASRYSIDHLVEETSLSIIYCATHLVWQRRVAIKVFKATSGLSAAEQADLLASFVREGAILAELSEICSGICQARDAGALTTAGGAWMPYTALEWLDGDSLEAVLTRARERGARPMTPRTAMRVLAPIAEALACAHARGIIHCDVKPGNIFVLRDVSEGEPRSKLLDFGIAKVVRDARTARSNIIEKAFTPGYGAPEQFESSFGRPGPWTDVYALALTFVEAICGREALQGDDFSKLCLQSCDPLHRPSPRALGVDVGDEVERVLLGALAVDPAVRFQDVRTFWAALSEAIVGPPSPPPPARRKRAWLPGVITVAIALALGLGAGLTRASGASSPPRQQAEGRADMDAPAATLRPTPRVVLRNAGRQGESVIAE